MSWSSFSVSDLELRLVGLESEVSGLRAQQVVMVYELDKAQAPLTDGSRSLVEWVQSHMDVSGSTARGLAGVARLTAQQRRVTSHDERRMFQDRFFVIQPSLDEGLYCMWGQLPGVAGRTVEKALHDRADELHRIATDPPSTHLPATHLPATHLLATRGQRQADALVAMAHDSLSGDSSGGRHRRSACDGVC